MGWKRVTIIRQYAICDQCGLEKLSQFRQKKDAEWQFRREGWKVKKFKCTCPDCLRATEQSDTRAEVVGDSESAIVDEPSREDGVEKCTGRAVDKIKRFFIEHPVHEFTAEQLSDYLGLKITLVKPILEALKKEGVIFESDGWKLKNLDLALAELDAEVTYPMEDIQ